MSRASLRDWLDGAMREELKRINETAKQLGKVWRRYEVLLIPVKSPLVNLLSLKPHCIKQNVNLELRQCQGIASFTDVLVLQLGPFEFIRSKIQGISWFQYTQVKSVVSDLLKA